MGRLIVFLLGICVALGASAVFGGALTLTRAEDIARDPRAWNGRDVRLRGTVTLAGQLPGTQFGVYQVGDGSGQLLVFSTAGAPAQNTPVVVRGAVRQGLSLTDALRQLGAPPLVQLIEPLARSYVGTHLVEQGRHTRYWLPFPP